MNEQEMFAAVGRKQTELDNLGFEYNRLLSVLNSVVNGELDVSRISIDLAARSWAVQAPDKPDDRPEHLND